MAVETASDQDFKEHLLNNDKVVVKYFASWCGNCRLFKPKYKRLSNDERFEGLQFIEVNAEENAEARKMAGVDNLPFFAAFNKGELVAGKAMSKEENVVELLNSLKNA